MIFARLIMPEDVDAVLDLAEMQVRETLPHLHFDREVARETLEMSLARAEPTFFVAEDNREVVGYVMCLLQGYAFTTGIFTVQEVLYVRPDKRGTRAAVHLVKEFVRWSKIVGAREMILGISNKFQPDRTARFYEKLTGAERVGVYLKKVM